MYVYGLVLMHHGVPVEVRGQHLNIDSFLPPCNNNNRTHIVSLSGKSLHPLSRLILYFDILGLTNLSRLDLELHIPEKP